MQRRHHVRLALRQPRVADGAFDEIHAVEAAFKRDGLGCFDQIVPRLDRLDPASALLGEEQIVEHKTEIGFPRAEIGQHRLIVLRERRVERGPDQVRQMQDLFQLASRIRVQQAVAGKDMQGLEQRDRLPRPKLRQHIRGAGRLFVTLCHQGVLNTKRHNPATGSARLGPRWRVAMVRKFDLVVVGGSFAGLACARTAALRGMKVAVLDAKKEPGARVRTTGIVVKEASDDFDLPARLMRKVRGVRLYAPDDRALDLHAPGYFFQATDTAGVLRWMADEAARAGAELMFGSRFEHGLEHARGVALPSLGLHASFLVGADGARSRVAESFGLSRNKRFLTGMEIECEELKGFDPRFLHCFADSAIAPGYIAWVVPG